MQTRILRDADLAKVHVARSGDGLVFLDLSTDSYSALYDRAISDPAADHDIPVIPHPTICDPRDGISHASTTIDGQNPAAHFWTDERVCDPPGATAIDLCRFLRALIAASLGFRNRPVRDLLEAIRRGRVGPWTGDQATHVIVADRFERFMTFVPVQTQCLFRSFALLQFLRLYGLDADWVFGVRLFPFSAHCWLAVDRALVGERAHRIEVYTPILTLARAMP